MQRRDFFKLAAGTAAAALATPSLLALDAENDTSASSSGQIYDLRIYRFKAGASTELLEHYLRDALIPVLKQMKIGPVGVFKTTESKDPSDENAIRVVIPYANLNQWLGVAALDNTPQIRSAAPDFFTKPTKLNPAYDRMDSTLLLAFTGQPMLVLPELSKTKSPRIFEFRNYESFSDDRNLAKVKMFNSGEEDAQREVGLNPVFYGQALTGPSLPRVVYLLAGSDRESHKKNWAKFSAHPTWKRLKADARFADTATHNTNVFTVPTDYSQI